jgi:hypothetical protein
MKFGSTAEEQREGESLDRLLAEEEPDPALELDDDLPEDRPPGSGDRPPGSGDRPPADTEEDSADEYVDGLLLDDGPDPRAGRLVAEDEGAHPDAEDELVARDAGIDDGAATAEEAAVHVVEEDDYDVRSDD